MNHTLSGAALVAHWRNGGAQNSPAGPLFASGSSQKQISLTSLACTPVTLLAPARYASLLLNCHDVASFR